MKKHKNFVKNKSAVNRFIYQRLQHSLIYILASFKTIMAESKGFEPLKRLPAYTVSNRAPSATRTTLHKSLLSIFSAVFSANFPQEKILNRL